MINSKVAVIRKGRIFDIRQADDGGPFVIALNRDETETVALLLLKEGSTLEEAEALLDHLEQMVQASVTLI